MEIETLQTRLGDAKTQQQNPRSLRPRQLLEKYIMGWECSVCAIYFELSESERHSMEAYGCEVPRRIRRMFDNHKCGRFDLCCVRQRQSIAVELEDVSTES